MSIARTPTLLERATDLFDVIKVFLGPLVQPKPQASNNKPSSPKRDDGTNQVDNLVALGVELTLRLTVAVLSGYLIMLLSRKFLSGLSALGEDAAPRGPVLARLAKILRKRQDAGKNDDSASKEITLPPLNSYEIQMAQDVTDPDDIEVSFHDIGGLDDTKREIWSLAVLPLLEPGLFTGKLVQPTKGILLFGKPGTGKTMLAKAIAREAQAVFLPLQLSKILNKYVGESNKIIHAAFSLAEKLQPCILFIDELDTFLKVSNSETAYLDAIKAEFLTLWDGIGTSETSRVLVLGATNKPHSIDSAILRRMPRAFAVPLPNAAGRLAILQLLLQGEAVQEDVGEFLSQLASDRLTAGYSGSDLKELCKAAAMMPVQERTEEFARQQVMGEKSASCEPLSRAALRPIAKNDFLRALEKVRRTGAAAQEYGREALIEALTEMKEEARLKKNISTSNDDDDDIPDV